MKVDRHKAEQSLGKKGFVKLKSHHIYFHHTYKGKITRISTHFSHTRKQKDISGDLLTSIRKQLCLDNNYDAIEFLNCPMSGNDYNDILKKKGIITD